MRKLFTLLLAVAASVGTMLAWDYERVQIGDLYYNLDATNQTAEVTYQNSNYPYWSTTITTANIPASVAYNSKTYSVTSIGESAFDGCGGLTSIEIPNSVTSIGIGVFRDCNSLHTIIIPDGVESIEREAFSHSGVSSITFPGSVSTIGDMAFSDCMNLQSVTFNEGNTIIGYGAFRMCNNLSSVTFPNSLTTIGSYAFENCGLSAITIPSGVTNIADGAFAECSNLNSISVDAGNTKYDSRNNCNAIIETSSNTLLTGCVNTIIPETVTGIGGDAFHGCYGLDSIHIPDGVRFLGESAFAYSAIKSISLPGSVRTIGKNAFDHCSQLTSISLSEGLDTIGYAGIYSCDKLTSIVLPHSLKSIDSYGFGYCNKLTSVEFLSETPPSIGNYGCFVSSPCEFIIPCGTENAYLNALNASDRYSFDISRFRPKAEFSYSIYSSSQVQGSVVITKHITCEDLTLSFRIDIAEGGNFIQWSDGSTEIERTITITQDTVIVALFGRMDCIEASGTCGAQGDNLTWELSCDSVLTIRGTGAMEDFGFARAPWYSYGTRGKIKSVIISEGVINIGNYAFYQAFNLDSVYIPSSVTSLGGEAFAISGLHKFTIPNTVTSIGEHVFSNCKSLESVSLSTGLTTISANAFYGCDRLTSVTIPNTITRIDSSAFSFCLSLDSIDIPNSIQYIGGSAFSVCESLKSIEIPNSVSYLAGNAFEYCSVLRTIEVASDNPYYCDLDGVVYSKDKTTVVSYPRGKHGAYVILEGVTSIGSNAFSVCDSLTAIDIPHSVNSISRGAFRGCVNLDSVIIPNNVTTIGTEAFRSCKFTSLEIGNNVVNIGEWAFGGNPNLISLEIPNSVKTIGKAAFMDCIGLNNIKVGNGVTNISTFAFFDCPNVSSFTILAPMPPVFDGNAFGTISQTTSLFVPCASLNQYQQASQWNSFANIFPLDTIEINLNLTVNDTLYGNVELLQKRYLTCDKQEYVIRANAQEGYQFIQWSDGSTDNPRTIELTQDQSIVAEFEPVLMATDLAMIYIDGIPVEGFETNKYSYTFRFPAGTSETNIPTADDITWELGDEYQTVSVSQTASTVVLNVTSGRGYAKTYVLAFVIENPNQFTVTTLSNNEEWGDVSGGNTYNENSTVIISALASEGYQFYHWNNSIKDNPYAFTLTQDTSFVAMFLPNTEEGIVSDVTSNSIHMEWNVKPWGNHGYWVWIYVDQNHEQWYCKMRFQTNGVLDKFYWGPASHHYDASMPSHVKPQNLHRTPARYLEASTVISYDLTELDAATTYFFTIEGVDEAEQVISAQAGVFTTEGTIPSLIEQPEGTAPLTTTKIIKNGHLFILRGEKVYNAQGALVK